MRTRLFFLPLALLRFALPFGVLLSACDGDGSNEGPDAAFFVGSWTLVRVQDDSGDRTDEVEAVVTDMRLTFVSGGTFELFLDFADPGTPDETIAGTYQVDTRTSTLVLNPADLSIPFGVSVQSNDRVVLSVAAALVEQILAGGPVQLDLTGTVRLTLDRD